jgi:hypothetical protein
VCTWLETVREKVEVGGKAFYIMKGRNKYCIDA